MKKPWRFLLLAGVVALASDCQEFSVPESDVIIITVTDGSGFQPSEVKTVPSPANIRWEWAETNVNAHNVTFDTATGSPLSSMNSPTQRTGVHGMQFSVAGVFPYWCTIHPEMGGVINIRPNICENGCQIFP